MKIEFEGRTWDVDTVKVTLAQAMVITARMGVSLAAWERTLAETENPQWLPAMQCLYWLMVQQDGQEVPLDSVTGFEVVTYSVAFAEAIERETAAAGVPEDPTGPPGTTGAQPGAEQTALPGTAG